MAIFMNRNYFNKCDVKLFVVSVCVCVLLLMTYIIGTHKIGLIYGMITSSLNRKVFCL